MSSGERFDHHPTDPTQWAPTPRPGSLLIPQPNDGSWACTVGPTVAGPVGVGWLTAQHCGDGHDAVGIFTDDDARTELRLGVLTSVDADASVVWAPGLPATRGAVHLADLPVAGVMADPLRDLAAGTPVCLSGGRAGVRCGPLVQSRSEVRYRLDPLPEGGDSGAPVFVVDRTGSVLLIGLHEGILERSGVAVAAPLAPILRAADAQVLTEPGAVAADPDLVARDLAVSR